MKTAIRISLTWFLTFGAFAGVAQTLTSTIQATASGIIGTPATATSPSTGQVFTNATITVTQVANTANRLPCCTSGYYVLNNSASISISGIGTFLVTTPTCTVSYPTIDAVEGVIFVEIGFWACPMIISDNYPILPFVAFLYPASSPWNLITSFGPIQPSVVIIGSGSATMTTNGGLLQLTQGTSSVSGLFQATFTGTPPPASGPKLNTTQLQFQYLTGSAIPPLQPIQVTSSGTQLSASVSSSVPWLTTSTLSSTTPFTVNVGVNPTGMAVGTYSGNIVIASGSSSQTANVSLTITDPPPTVKLNTTQLQFQYLKGSATPPLQPIQITSSGTQMSASISLTVPWLTASTLSGTTPLTVNVGVNPTGMAVGTYSGQVVIAGGTSPTQTANVTLTITPDLRPVIASTVNGASFKSGVGPGAWISIIGTNFANTTTGVSAPFLPSLNGVSAQLSGVGGAYSLLMYYLSPTQINAFVPMELSPSLFGNTCSVAVTTSNGTASYTTQCQSLTPALFNYGTQHYASATHIDGTIVGVIPGTLPAQSGSIITLWGTGFGQTTPPTSTININYVGVGGVLASPVVILVNNTPATVLYAGMVGVGLYQFNIQLPDGLASGDYALTIQVNGVTTDPVVLPIR
jgi:uncharacterized protein (TIGR03437 family)